MHAGSDYVGLYSWDNLKQHIRMDVPEGSQHSIKASMDTAKADQHNIVVVAQDGGYFLRALSKVSSLCPPQQHTSLGFGTHARSVLCIRCTHTHTLCSYVRYRRDGLCGPRSRVLTVVSDPGSLITDEPHYILLRFALLPRTHALLQRSPRCCTSVAVQLRRKERRSERPTLEKYTRNQHTVEMGNR